MKNSTPDSLDRRQRKHAQLRRTILAAASKLFAEEGYNSTTVRRIADEADCSQGTLYTHFVDKNAILHHLCRETFTGMEAALDGISGGSAVDRLLEASRIFARFSLDHPHHFQMFVMTPSDFGDLRAVEFVSSIGLPTFLKLRKFYEDADFANSKEYGSFVWWNGLKGVVSFVLLHRAAPFFDGDRLIEEAIQTLLRGQEVVKR